MTDIAVDPRQSQSVKLDATGIALIEGLTEQGQLPDMDIDPDDEEVTLEDVLDTIHKRIKNRLEETGSGVYRSLAERIEKLRAQSVQNAGDSIEFLKKALEMAQQVVKADRMEADGTLDDNEHLFDEHLGALTQIVEENKPDELALLVPDLVFDIDTIVHQVAFTGWADTSSGDREVKKELRRILKKFGLPLKGILFDRSYEYIKENY